MTKQQEKRIREDALDAINTQVVTVAELAAQLSITESQLLHCIHKDIDYNYITYNGTTLAPGRR
jgi:hypothetical protein